jgi:hypothetical protein
MCRYWVYATNWVRVFGWRAGIGAARWEAGLGMSRTGRAGDGPDAIPDEPRHETAVGVDRGTILTQACARRECALAYRATVDAVYAEAELDAGARRPVTTRPRSLPERGGRISQQTAPGPPTRDPRARAWTRKTGQGRGDGKHAVNLIECTI